MPMKVIRGVDTIRFPLDSYVHQYQVGTAPGGFPYSVLHRSRDAGDLEAFVLQTALNIGCDNALILNDENAALASGLI
jgi:hypothetical protein